MVVNTNPVAYTVTGGGAFCTDATGATGVPIGLSNSEIGVSYQLQLPSTGFNVGTPVSGTGTAISFGNQTILTNYIVLATKNTSTCTTRMIDSVVVRATTTVYPYVTIELTTGSQTVCEGAGTSVTFTATPISGGTTPTYQWKKGGINISGATSRTYTSTAWTNGDVITCAMTASAEICAYQNERTATSEGITMNVTATTTFVNTNTSAVACAGTTILSVNATTASDIVWYNSTTLANTAAAPITAVTMAGTGISGAGTNQFSTPSDVFVDGSGNMFIADKDNHRIQKWAPGAALGTTVAGGNGRGLASNQLNTPMGIFVDGSGNIFIADKNNNRIQKWTPGATSGTTVAGSFAGSGSTRSDQLINPQGVFVDGSGNIYIADTDNNRIQRWGARASEGTTVAGGFGAGSADNQLWSPTGVYVDGSGNIYIADQNNNRIQKGGVGRTVTVAGGNLGGSADNQLRWPSDVYVDGSGNIFIADTYNNRIQKWARGALSGTTVAGGNGSGSANNQLTNPTGVCLNAYGKVFIADAGNHRIQKAAPVASNTYTPTTAGSYTAVVTVNGCSTTTNAVVINPLPTAPSVTALVNYCNNVPAVALTATGTNLKWYTIATGINNGRPTATPSTEYVGTTAYWVTQTNVNSCESPRSLINVVINPLPNAPTTTTTITYCQNATPSALTAIGSNLRWYTVATGGTSSATAPTPTTTTAGMTSYWVIQTDMNGCESPRARIDVFINPLPIEPLVTPPPAYCQNAVATALTATGVNLKWYLVETGGSSSVNAPIPSTTTAGTRTYWVTQTDMNGCESPRAQANVVVNPLPNAPLVTVPVNLCRYAVASALTATGTNLKWYAAATGGTPTTAPIPNTANVSTASYWVSQTDANSCESPRAKMDVVINPLPNAPLVTTPVTHCRYAVAGALTANGTNLKWYNAAIGGVGTATAIPKTDSIGTTAYWVTQTNANGCESDRTKIEVAVEVFKNTLLRQRTLCKDQYFAFDLKNSQYPNLTHTWTSSTNYTSNKETDTLRNAGTYYVQTTTALGCKSNDSLTITLNTAFIESNFAVATQLVTVDVIKVVNISNSSNDSTRWIVPAGLNIISNTPALLEIVARDTGRYSLGLMTFKGVCSDVTYQNIHIYPKTFDQNANDTLYFVKTFTAYPNPTNQGDNLRVKIELTKESSVKLRLIDANMNTIIDNKVLQGSATYDVDYGTTLRKGTYILFLESPYGRNVLKIIVL